MALTISCFSVPYYLLPSVSHHFIHLVSGLFISPSALPPLSSSSAILALPPLLFLLLSCWPYSLSLSLSLSPLSLSLPSLSRVDSGCFHGDVNGTTVHVLLAGCAKEQQTSRSWSTNPTVRDEPDDCTTSESSPTTHRTHHTHNIHHHPNTHFAPTTNLTHPSHPPPSQNPTHPLNPPPISHILLIHHQSHTPS